MKMTNLAEPATPGKNNSQTTSLINSTQYTATKHTQREPDGHPCRDILIGHGQLAGVAVLVLERTDRERIPLGHLLDVVLARFVRLGDVVDDATGGGSGLLDHVPHAEELQRGR